MDLSYIIIPLLVMVVCQTLKLATDGIRGNFDIKNIFLSYGGMPSSHTAFSISITTLVGLRLGIDSPLFAVSLVFAFLVMRDASTFRNLLGKQAKVFNRYIRQLPEKDRADIPLFREQLGHSVAEVSAGATLGFALTWALALL